MLRGGPNYGISTRVETLYYALIFSIGYVSDLPHPLNFHERIKLFFLPHHMYYNDLRPISTYRVHKVPFN